MAQENVGGLLQSLGSISSRILEMRLGEDARSVNKVVRAVAVVSLWRIRLECRGGYWE